MITTMPTYAHCRTFGFMRRPECDDAFTIKLREMGAIAATAQSMQVYEPPHGQFLFAWPRTMQPKVARARGGCGAGYEPADEACFVLPANLVTKSVKL